MYLYVKRLLDLLLASSALIVLLPAGVLIALLLWGSTGGNPFFVQERPGRGGRIFRLLKFRTMYDRRDADGNLLPDDERFTRVGRFVRRASLDELPQLINVLAGDMSLIGPRPLLTEYLPLYTPFQARRHAVRPGITGWAQVNGRNTIGWEQKFVYDVWYVDQMSFGLDAKILWMTLGCVLRGRGVEAQPKRPMEKFTGTPLR